MRKNILLFLLAGIIALLSASCKKYLDAKSDSKLTTPQTLESLQAVLDDHGAMNQRRSASFGEASADDYFWTTAQWNNASTFFRDLYTWQPVTIAPSGFDWAPGYNPVYNSNLCMELLEKIPVTDANRTSWNNVKGSSLFYKSYYYLGLVWSYGKAWDENTSSTDLGIVLRKTSDLAERSVRASVKESYEAILTGAKESISYLPDIPLHVMRPSKSSAYGLLARAYLSMRKYDSAGKYANLALELKSGLINFNGDADINGSLTAATPFKPFNKETIFYSTMNINTSFWIPAAGALIDSVLYGSFEANDLRKTAYFSANSGYYRFKGNYGTSTTEIFSGITTAEMYLIRAEAAARAGNKDAALIDLNTVLSKRYNGTFVPVTTATAEAALSRILIERRKELIHRGLRWIEIKRLNKEGANIVLQRKTPIGDFTLQPNANYYALPLPVDLINLAGIPQNPY